MSETEDQVDYVSLATQIVSAYVSNNPIPAADLPSVISSVHSSLRTVAEPVKAALPAQKPEPAVPVRKSITPDYLVCLYDGKRFKSLKRHLRSTYDVSPEEYRAAFDLPSDYPMVAPNYAAERSALAKKIGLGRKPGSRRASAAA
ncbi:MAG: MucR family transcriptional regulator [Stutzerimonas stutzeri]|nr:MAG: MucR family transcriptional regulator [Stutzerimonas stutzeri]